jgi:hypothetical protein
MVVRVAKMARAIVNFIFKLIGKSSSGILVRGGVLCRSVCPWLRAAERKNERAGPREGEGAF